MAEARDIVQVKSIITAMLCQASGTITDDEVKWIADVLGYLCTNYTPTELDHIIIRTAMENSDRPLRRPRFDS